jgi:hypothetical protein
MINNAANHLMSGKEINAEIFDVKNISPKNERIVPISKFAS